ncbi:MAG: 1,4-alpha-glucan branching enzyme [Myxococcota bacterium]|jgi:1,4-alpha-glucan branching enzyme
MNGLGSFALVLHGHMPWVLNHGRWPHGEHWLYEAALGVYLPLLETIDIVDRSGGRAGLTLGLTPVLLEQLANDRFKQGFYQYLRDLIRRAQADRSDPQLGGLAAWWETQLTARLDQFDALGGDIVGAFAAHARAERIELLSSLATHGYAPLLLHDQALRAQLRIGLQVSERHLGFRPEGVWLPECAFRPSGPWQPPLVHTNSRNRIGVDRILEEEGVSFFFVDAHMFEGIRSEGLMEPGGFRKVPWSEADTYPGRGWRSVLEPHRISTVGQQAKIAALARHPKVSEQVWSADAGYPGDGMYLEFHKKRHGDGLRYWRVTRRGTDLGDKELYEPDLVPAATFRQARHLGAIVRDELGMHRTRTGRPGVVVAPFDAELFGHWWFEGPRFLKDLLLHLGADPDIEVQTVSERLRAAPPDKVAWLPEGSWGEGGDHRVWLNEQSKWTWEAAYRAEDRFFTLLWDVKQCSDRRTAARAQAALERAGRELLLLQASDWAFVVRTGGAVDYGFRRLAEHITRFERMANLTQDLLGGADPTPLQEIELADIDAHDDCFTDLSLDAWR